MDFFSKDFNASLALKELAVPDGQTPVIFDSIDEFEENLIRTNAPLVRELQKIEADKRCTKKKRKERLSNVCAAVGRTVLETLPSKKTVQKSDAGPLKKLSECVEQKRCVTIVLRGLNTVNCHISAQIVSFDNHWNLIIRCAIQFHSYN
ncbi:unnamed protein product [Gongylonema pulchrum]|uniref:Sm domain-containing protein n=1 Tax=Gongylonema pulchrum TaxID=637853 RepID=A0A183E1J6_9BILA|nr:unnamed protein product [Gongylonema pulchrum]